MTNKVNTHSRNERERTSDFRRKNHRFGVLRSSEHEFAVYSSGAMVGKKEMALMNNSQKLRYTCFHLVIAMTSDSGLYDKIIRTGSI